MKEFERQGQRPVGLRLAVGLAAEPCKCVIGAWILWIVTNGLGDSRRSRGHQTANIRCPIFASKWIFLRPLVTSVLCTLPD